MQSICQFFMTDSGSVTFINPPGKSGPCGNKHYSDQVEIWAADGQIETKFLNARELDKRLVLEPATR